MKKVSEDNKQYLKDCAEKYSAMWKQAEQAIEAWKKLRDVGNELMDLTEAQPATTGQERSIKSRTIENLSLALADVHELNGKMMKMCDVFDCAAEKITLAVDMIEKMGDIDMGGLPSLFPKHDDGGKLKH